VRSAPLKLVGGALAIGLLAGAATFSLGEAKTPPRAELNITVNENFVFLPLRLRVQAGVPVRLRLTHLTPAKGPDIVHTLVLLNRSANVEEFGQAVLTAKPEDNYVPDSFRGQVLAATALIHSGGAAELNFQAPSVPGNYPLVCSFPGHCLLGMTGTLVVE